MVDEFDYYDSVAIRPYRATGVLAGFAHSAFQSNGRPDRPNCGSVRIRQPRRVEGDRFRAFAMAQKMAHTV